MPFLSKSKYLSGLQCSKLLWHLYNAKELLPPVDASTQAIFDQGHQIGNLRSPSFPGALKLRATIRIFQVFFGTRRKRWFIAGRCLRGRLGFGMGSVGSMFWSRLEEKREPP